jgi:NAD(P)-dependent dehydrogenase (short-subunit alcohol dehydrogenase family)
MWDKMLAVRTERHGLPREQLFDNLLKQVPLGRPQDPDEVAKVVLFLSSEVSRSITGEAINVNGSLRMDWSSLDIDPNIKVSASML